MGRTHSCWVLNWWCITWPVGFKRLRCLVCWVAAGLLQSHLTPIKITFKYFSLIMWEFYCLQLNDFRRLNTCVLHITKPTTYRDADKSIARPGRKQARKHVRDARDFNNIETRSVIKLFFLQGKAPKEIQAILTETLACFLPCRAKDLSASLYWFIRDDRWVFLFVTYVQPAVSCICNGTLYAFRSTGLL